MPDALEKNLDRALKILLDTLHEVGNTQVALPDAIQELLEDFSDKRKRLLDLPLELFDGQPLFAQFSNGLS